MAAMVCVTVFACFAIWQARVLYDDYLHTSEKEYIKLEQHKIDADRKLREHKIDSDRKLREHGIDAERKIKEKRIDAKRSMIETALKPQYVRDEVKEDRGWFSTVTTRRPIFNNVYHQMAIAHSHQSMLTDEGSDVTWW